MIRTGTVPTFALLGRGHVSIVAVYVQLFGLFLSIDHCNGLF